MGIIHQWTEIITMQAKLSFSGLPSCIHYLCLNKQLQGNVPSVLWKYQKGSGTEPIWAAAFGILPRAVWANKAKGKAPVPPSLHLPSDSEQLEMAALLLLLPNADRYTQKSEGSRSAKEVSVLSPFWGWGKGWGLSDLYSNPWLNGQEQGLLQN